MARKSRGPDWQQRAFDQSQTERRDRKVGMPADAPDPVSTPTVRKPRRSSWRWSAIGAGALALAIIIHARIADEPPSLTTSCTTPAFAVSTLSTHTGGLVRWSVTGPSSTRFLLTIGIERLQPTTATGTVHAVPVPGSHTQVAAPSTVLSSSCKAHGAFDVNLPAGHYALTMFRIESAGGKVGATAVATKQLSISSSG